MTNANASINGTLLRNQFLESDGPNKKVNRPACRAYGIAVLTLFALPGALPCGKIEAVECNGVGHINQVMHGFVRLRNVRCVVVTLHFFGHAFIQERNATLRTNGRTRGRWGKHTGSSQQPPASCSITARSSDGGVSRFASGYTVG